MTRPSDEEIAAVKANVKYEVMSHNGDPIPPTARGPPVLTGEETKLFEAINSYPPSSADSTIDEPSPTAHGAAVKWKCLVANVMEGINDDPNQFVPFDELPKGLQYRQLQDSVAEWMTELRDPGTFKASGKSAFPEFAKRSDDESFVEGQVSSHTAPHRPSKRDDHWSVTSEAGSPTMATGVCSPTRATPGSDRGIATPEEGSPAKAASSLELGSCAPNHEELLPGMPETA